VSTHMRHIYQKTGVANKQQLLDLAFPKGKAE
jgi:DNA-binding CsgD family transcriptional regulator